MPQAECPAKASPTPCLTTEARRVAKISRLVLALVLVAAACSTSPATHYERGAAAADRGDWPTAIAELEAAGPYQDAHQRSLDAILAEADEREKAGDLDTALALLQRAGTYKDADQHAKQLDGTRTVLAILYGQMTTAAATNDWQNALKLSGQIVGIVPGFRDVQAKRTGYIDTVYSLASASIAKPDWPNAVVLLTALVHEDPGYKDAQALLARARVESRRPLPGFYASGEDLQDGIWYGQVRGIEVASDGRLTMTVRWSNDADDQHRARCGGGRGARAPQMILADGTRQDTLGVSCSVHNGELVPADGTFDESATFPSLADGTRPFRVDWYGLKLTGPFVLVR